MYRLVSSAGGRWGWDRPLYLLQFFHIFAVIQIPQDICKRLLLFFLKFHILLEKAHQQEFHISTSYSFSTFIKTNSSLQIQIKAVEIKISIMVFNLDFDNNAILSCFFFFFLNCFDSYFFNFFSC